MIGVVKFYTEADMLTNEQILNIDKEMQAGMSPEDVAEKLDISRSTLYNYLLRAGLEIERTITWRLVPIKRSALDASELVEVNR